jgi:hypothetical protein
MRKSAIAPSGVFAVSLLLVWAIARSAQAQEAGPPDQTCGEYQLSYRAVTMQNGREAAVNDKSAREIMSALLACAEQRLTAGNRGRYHEKIKTAAPLKHGAAGPAAAAMQFDIMNDLQEGTADAERHMAHIVADQLKPGAAGNIAKEQDNAAYINACSKLMPIPPPLNTKGPKGWTKAPDFIHTNSFKNPSQNEEPLFLLKERKSELWTFRDDKGFCVAMARTKIAGGPKEKESGFDDAFVGTICTDHEQAHACFFDNLVYGDNGTLKPLTYEETLSAEYTSLVSPGDMANKCTLCHMGQNPYIVKTDTTSPDDWAIAAALLPLMGKTAPREMYEVTDTVPKQLEDWVNPPKLTLTGKEGACLTCHNLPDPVSKKPGQKAKIYANYCNTVLSGSAANTMPPHKEVKAGWGVPNATGYADSVRKLKSLCTGE